MRDIFFRLTVRAKILFDVIKEEHGQDLVEYAAVIALVVLGITSGMNTLAGGINNAMNAVTTKINTAL